MMNSGEIDRKMEFIVAQQAKFAVDIELLREAQAKTDEKVAQLTDTISQTNEALVQVSGAVVQVGGAVVQVTEIVTRLAHVTNEGFKQVNAKIDALVDSHIRMEDELKASQKRTDERFEELAASQKRTDQMLQKFLRGLRERRNGK